MDCFKIMKESFMREVLGREYIDKTTTYSFTSEPIPPRPTITATINCELSKGWKIDPETGDKLHDEPVMILLAKGITTDEIPDRYREHARYTLIEWGKPYAPIGTPDEDTVVIFSDEGNLVKWD